MNDEIDKFLNRLKFHVERKAQLYDGINGVTKLTSAIEIISWMIEELGEIASAINRDRTNLAKSECFDLAHLCLMLHLFLDKSTND